MTTFIIEKAGKVREAFSYEHQLRDETHQSLREYTLANYGGDAVLRTMTEGEAAGYKLYGSEFFEQQSSRGRVDSAASWL